MRDVRKVREESLLRLTYPQFFALLGLAAVSLVLSGLLGYYFGRGATAAEQAAVLPAAPLVPEDVETESVATLLALAAEKNGAEAPVRLDYDQLLPRSPEGLPQMLRKGAEAEVAPADSVPREVEPAQVVSDEAASAPASVAAVPPAEAAVEAAPAPPTAPPPKVDPAQAPGGFTIQVNSFQSPSQAQAVVDELKRQGFEAYRIQADVNGRTWHRVRVGSYRGREEANAEMERLSVIRSDLRPMVTVK